jgi:methionine-rich copper-binding protein CopC
MWVKNPKKVINQKVTITFEGSIEATQEQLKELQEYLNKNKKFKKQKWNVTNLEIIPAPALKSSEDEKKE